MILHSSCMHPKVLFFKIHTYFSSKALASYITLQSLLLHQNMWCSSLSLPCPLSKMMRCCPKSYNINLCQEKFSISSSNGVRKLKKQMSLMCPRLTRTTGQKTMHYIVLHLKLMRWSHGNYVGLCGLALCWQISCFDIQPTWTLTRWLSEPLYSWHNVEPQKIQNWLDMRNVDRLYDAFQNDNALMHHIISSYSLTLTLRNDNWMSGIKEKCFFIRHIWSYWEWVPKNSGTSSNRTPFMQHQWDKEGDNLSLSSQLWSWSKRWCFNLSQVCHKQQWHQHCEHTPSLLWGQFLRHSLVCIMIVHLLYMFLHVSPTLLSVNKCNIFLSTSTLVQDTVSLLTYIMLTLFLWWP